MHSFSCSYFELGLHEVKHHMICVKQIRQPATDFAIMTSSFPRELLLWQLTCPVIWPFRLSIHQQITIFQIFFTGTRIKFVHRRSNLSVLKILTLTAKKAVTAPALRIRYWLPPKVVETACIAAGAVVAAVNVTVLPDGVKGALTAMLCP